MEPSSLERAEQHAEQQIEGLTLNVIGAGRLGCFFAGLSKSKVYGRQDELVGFEKGPILVATRNDDLAAVVGLVPKNRHDDLVFLQNGMYFDHVKKLGVEHATYMLVYFAISAKGEKPVDGGETVITGKYSDFFSELLKNEEIAIDVVSRDTFLQKMYQKLLWSVIFGLLCKVYGLSVGELVETHRSDISELTRELSLVIEECEGVRLPDSTEQALCDYSQSISAYKGDVKEWSWRNGWFIDRKKTPLHQNLLSKVGF